MSEQKQVNVNDPAEGQSELNAGLGVACPWLYSTSSTRESAILRRLCWGNPEAQTAIDSLDAKYMALREATKNAVHAKCFGTMFNLEAAQNALYA